MTKPFKCTLTCATFCNTVLEARTFFKVAAGRIEALEKPIGEADEAPPAIQLGMADRYVKALGRLVAALNDEAHRTEAAAAVRDLVDRIVLGTNETRSALTIDLSGDLAGLLSIADDEEPRAGGGGLVSSGFVDEEALSAVVQGQDKLVAGAGFEPAAFRL